MTFEYPNFLGKSQRSDSFLPAKNCENLIRSFFYCLELMYLMFYRKSVYC